MECVALSRYLVASALVAVVAASCVTKTEPTGLETTPIADLTTTTGIVPSAVGTATVPPTPTPTTTTTKADTTPPALEVVSPTDGATVTSKIVEFRGVTEPGARVFSGPYEADVDQNGNWLLILVVTPGDNGAVLTARDDAGNKATVRLVITYERPATTTTPPTHDCERLESAVVPESATNLSSVAGDLDGDGLNDVVTVYEVDSSSWVHMELNYGYASAVEIEEAFLPEAVGTVNVGGPGDVALVEVSHGATTDHVGVFAMIGCEAMQATYVADDNAVKPTRFFVGSSMQYAYGTACISGGVVQTSGQRIGDGASESGLWEVSVDEYAYLPGRGHFELASSWTTQLIWPDDREAIDAVYHFDCPGDLSM